MNIHIHNCLREPAPTRSRPLAPDANRSAIFTLATALLLCLAMTGRATAESPQVDADTPEAAAAEDGTGTFTSEEDLSMDTFEDGGGTLPDENGNVVAGTDVQPSAAEEEELSEGKQFQQDLKRTLVGLLLPVMERKIRDAAGVEDEPSGQIAEAEQEYEQAYDDGP